MHSHKQYSESKLNKLEISNKIFFVLQLSMLTVLSLALILSIYKFTGHKASSQYRQVKTLYLLGVALILPLIFISYLLLENVNRIIFLDYFISKKTVTFFWITFVIFLCSRKNFLLLPTKAVISSQYGILLLLFGIELILCCLNMGNHKLNKIFFCVLITVTFIMLFLIFRANFQTICSEGTWNWINFNTVFSSVVQASVGQLPLVDYYAQYGYYSLFLKSIFNLIPLTVLNFTWIMAILTYAVFLFLYKGLRTVIINRFICVTAFIACMYALLIYRDYMVYWAYLPVRLIFPACVFWLVCLYNLNRNSKLYHLIFILATLSIAWNVDTGIVLLGSWVLFLGYIKLSVTKKIIMKDIVKILITGFLYISVMLIIYAIYAHAIKGMWPEYQKIFIFQQMFFGQGIVSLPIKVFDTWTLVILIYICGLGYSFSTLFEKSKQKPNQDAALIMFLSIMGIGFFSYFIMRSYVTNIFVVSWPSFVILAIFADRMNFIFRLAAFFSILPLIFLSLNAISLTSMPADLSLLSVPKGHGLRDQREWVKNLNLQYKNVIILSDKSGIFYLDSKSRNPIALPGSTEIMHGFFIERIIEYIKTSTKRGYLLIDSEMTLYSLPIFEDLHQLTLRLPVVSQSSDKKLTLFAFH